MKKILIIIAFTIVALATPIVPVCLYNYYDNWLYLLLVPVFVLILFLLINTAAAIGTIRQFDNENQEKP